MKFLLPAIIAAILLLPTWANAATPASSIATAEASTVIVFGHVEGVESGFMGMQMPFSAENMPYCSGVLIRSDAAYDVVITARHCVTHTDDQGNSFDPVPMAVKFNNGKRYRVLWYGYSHNDDLGVLAVAKTSHAPISVNTFGVEHWPTNNKAFICSSLVGAAMKYDDPTRPGYLDCRTTTPNEIAAYLKVQ